MAIINGEKYGTRTLGGDRAERVYVIREATDDLDAMSALISVAPLSIANGIKNIPIDIDNIEVLEIDDAQGIYEGTVPYRSGSGASIDEVGEFSLSYDISVTNYTLKYSRQTVSSGAIAGVNKVNFGKAINATKTGVEGVDYQVPVMQGNITKVFSEGQITDAYIGNLYKTVGTVNAGFFRGLQAGEGLLTSVDLKSNQDGTWNGTFGWGISPNETNLDVGNGLIVPSKRGWDYLWIAYATTDEGDFGPVQKPWQYNVEQIYPYTNWGVLNIG